MPHTQSNKYIIMCIPNAPACPAKTAEVATREMTVLIRKTDLISIATATKNSLENPVKAWRSSRHVWAKHKKLRKRNVPCSDHKRRCPQQDNACVGMSPLHSPFKVLHSHQPTIQLSSHLIIHLPSPRSIYLCVCIHPSIQPTNHLAPFISPCTDSPSSIFTHLSFIRLSTQPSISRYQSPDSLMSSKNHPATNPLTHLSSHPTSLLHAQFPWIFPSPHTCKVTSPWFCMGDIKSPG